MFTGLVESVGRVADVTRTGSVVSLSIEANFAGELKKGQSVCVSGACLTVVGFDKKKFSVEMMNETIEKTKFRTLHAGDSVNLERALAVGDRLDGHFVLGHIDGVCRIINVKVISAKITHIVEISAPEEICAQIVPKGSVALDGVSLTVIDVYSDSFTVGLIPTTLADCTLGKIKTGDLLNIETDIIGKYILKKSGGANDTLSMQKLAEMGW